MPCDYSGALRCPLVCRPVPEILSLFRRIAADIAKQACKGWHPNLAIYAYFGALPDAHSGLTIVKGKSVTCVINLSASDCPAATCAHEVAHAYGLDEQGAALAGERGARSLCPFHSRHT